MKVVALCASVPTALRLWRGLWSVAGVDMRFLVFGTSLSYQVRVTGLKNLAPAAGLALADRLHITRHGLDHPRTLEWLQQLQPDVGLHACGSIYRKPLIACFRRGILNPHIGLLPAFRGRSVMEWSILQERPTGVTVFFIDEGIDTGREIVLRREVPLRGHRGVGAAKDFLFSLDVPMFAEALELLQRPNFALLQNDSSGRRFYVMSRLFSGVVDAALRNAEPT